MEKLALDPLFFAVQPVHLAVVRMLGLAVWLRVGDVHLISVLAYVHAQHTFLYSIANSQGDIHSVCCICNIELLYCKLIELGYSLLQLQHLHIVITNERSVSRHSERA